MTKVAELKKENIDCIRKCFYDRNIWTKNALSRQTGISLAASTNVIKYLLEQEEIIQIEDARSTGGRKSKQYILNKDHCHIGTMILKKTQKDYQFLLSVIDLFGNACYEETVVFCDAAVEDFSGCLKKLLKHRNIRSIIISIPGVCISGVIRICDFYHFENIDIGSEIRQYTDIPFVIENDVNVGVIGLSSIYPNIKNMVLVYQPACDFFGCGILCEGKLYNGCRHSAGELRYLPMTDIKDPKEILLNHIQILKAVLDPEMIGWCSDMVEEDIEGDILVHVRDLYACIREGLYQIAIHQIKNGGL